ncbi:MAG: transporter [Rubritepida sp.]|nr:transporter [Rubritepida sp.]
MSTGLIALLDDVVGLAKVAAASLDDVVGQAAKAGAKAAGVVIDDAAVTPRYVVGFAADRELPIVRKIATGSLRNKLLFLLPAALALSAFAPWAITPLLMLGGAFLCYEGAEKVYGVISPHAAHAHGASLVVAEDPRSMEDAKVSGAIKTDFILSAEIMAIALATIPTASFWAQAVTLAVVGIGITALVYGAVALIVKADDAGVAMARSGMAPIRALGRGLVLSMPPFLKLLSIVGTAAMVWVGGGIILHGLEGYGFATLTHAVHDAAVAAGRAVPAMAAVAEWIVSAACAGILGLLIGAALIPLVERVAMPLLRKSPA